MTQLLDLFTPDGYRVLTQAQRVAKTYQQTVITPDHVLLGLLQLGLPQVEAALREARVAPLALQTRLEAALKVEAKTATPVSPEIGYQDRYYTLSVATASIVTTAHQEAQEQHLTYIDPRLLLLAMLRQPDNSAGEVLRQYGLTAETLRPTLRLHDQPPLNQPRFRLPRFESGFSVWGISPIFLGLVGFTLLSGYLTYIRVGNPSRTLFLFVVGGWLTSVALHEFGHALVAFWGGDKSVVDKGYLTLDPLKYTHPLLSIVFPLIFLLMGGMPLSGGAVYIQTEAIRSRFMRSFAAAAGPLATGLYAGLLSLPFITGLYTQTLHGHMEFWAGVALLVFLEFFALFLNLLPFPGLDGFHIMEPFLPHEVMAFINPIKPFAFILLFFILSRSPVGTYLMVAASFVLIKIDPHLAYLAAEGFGLFFFWQL